MTVATTYFLFIKAGKYSGVKLKINDYKNIIFIFSCIYQLNIFTFASLNSK